MSEPPIHTTADHVHAHPRHTGIPKLDLVLALTAVFISGVSLFVAFEHSHTEQQLVQANSWPILQLHGGFALRGVSELVVKNSGVGPAKLETLELLYKGRPVAGTRELLALCCGLPAGSAATEATFVHGVPIYSIVGDVLRPGDQETLIQLVGSDALHDGTKKFEAAMPDVTFRACYCSVFDQCWMSNLNTLHPAPVRQCPDHTVDFNANME